MKYWHLVIEIIHGEYTFFSKSVHCSSNKTKFNANGYVKDFYDGVDGAMDKHGWYTFNAGDVACRVYSLKEITQKEYDVLTGYM